MSFPLSPSAAIGAAGLAARAAAQVTRGSIEAVSEFADVLAHREPDASKEVSAASVDGSIASESLSDMFSDLLRQFGIGAEHPISVSMVEGSDDVQIDSPGASDELASRIDDLQTTINADDSLRSKITQSLRQLPGHVFSMSPS